MSDPNHQTWWVFTFRGCDPQAGHYVKFFGTFQEAREQMLAKYGTAWAFQYSEYEWNRYRDLHPFVQLETELTLNDTDS